MAVMQLEDCWCCSLKTGVLVIGICSIILCVADVADEAKWYYEKCSGPRAERSNDWCAQLNTRPLIVLSCEVGEVVLMALTIFGSLKKIFPLLFGVIIIQAVVVFIFSLLIWNLVIDLFMFANILGIIGGLIGNTIIAFVVYLWLIIYSRTLEIRDEIFRPAEAS